jgi:hypothetical protein
MSLPNPTFGEWAKFAKMGDINQDGYINDADIAIIQAAWGSRPGDANWNPLCDLNGDGIINLLDLGVVTFNYGKDIWTALVYPDQKKRAILYVVGGASALFAVAGIAYYALRKR